MLRGHHAPDSALIAHDQPYNRGGSIRTTIRYWVHTTARGQQHLMSQSQGPATGNWNPYRAGAPKTTVFLVRYDSGRVGGIEIPVVVWPTDWVSFWLTGIWRHLNDTERFGIVHRLRLMAARNPIQWDAWSALIDRMTQRGLPPLEEWLDLDTHISADEYANLARYIRLGGPDLRDKQWFTIPAQTEADSREQ
ncbi:hypothetical protein ACFWPH_28300 [Nocardia sp. NPDC058499]|uniref:hypothetical protein n=1 Tax=Nocardia sp. NPDC058499 TaxID=3346530 RepID=UPI00365B5825